MKKITSRTNQTIKDICTLHSKKGRTARGCFIAEGARTIQTLLESNLTLKQLYITIDLPHTFSCTPDSITYVSPEVMQKISTTKTPCGYLAVFNIPEIPSQKLHRGLVLANIADPGNMGTLIRSAAAFTSPTVVIIGGTDPWSPKVIHATAGTIGMVNIYQYSWSELLAAKGTTKLCAFVVDQGTPIEKSDISNALLVIGSESHGISHNWITDCDERVTINMPGKTESLNAAVAGSIALYIAQNKAA